MSTQNNIRQYRLESIEEETNEEEESGGGRNVDECRYVDEKRLERRGHNKETVENENDVEDDDEEEDSDGKYPLRQLVYCPISYCISGRSRGDERARGRRAYHHC